MVGVLTNSRWTVRLGEGQLVHQENAHVAEAGAVGRLDGDRVRGSGRAVDRQHARGHSTDAAMAQKASPALPVRDRANRILSMIVLTGHAPPPAAVVRWTFVLVQLSARLGLHQEECQLARSS